MMSGLVEYVRNQFLSMRRFTRTLLKRFSYAPDARIKHAISLESAPKEALAIVKDLFETLANRPGFSVEVHPGQHGEFEVISGDTRSLISLLLRRQRERSGLSLAEAA